MEKSTYHHGDLRTAVLDAAEVELKADPRCNLSVRALAGKIGVSATAPHAHFKTKADLLAALAVRGFDRLRERLIRESEGIVDAGQKFAALAEAYLEFGKSNPGLYRIMFQTGIDFEQKPEVREASLKSFSVLQDAIQEFQPTEPLYDEADISFAGWALVHGMTSLLAEGRVIPEVARSSDVATLAEIAGKLVTPRASK